MITLLKQPYPTTHIPSYLLNELYKEMALTGYQASGLQAAQRVSKKEGYITIENTPGSYNYNPKNRLVKTVFYVNEPHTRYGYLAKFKITNKGLMTI